MKEQKKMKFYQAYRQLVPLLLFTIVLLLLRMLIARSFAGLFICWNLFLAILPLYFSYMALQLPVTTKSRVLMLLWLLFFPNAAYLVTDLIHLLDMKDGISRWLDLVLLVSAAINGLLYSMLSLSNIELALKRYLSSKHVNLIIFILLLLCGYGIYLGRCLRWNSWDIVVTPVALFEDIFNHLMRPVHHRQVWFTTLLFASWLYILYLLFSRYAHRRK